MADDRIAAHPRLATGLFFFGIANQVRDEEESVVAFQALRAEIATAQSSVRGGGSTASGFCWPT
jgi:hypothetical protein